MSELRRPGTDAQINPVAEKMSVNERANKRADDLYLERDARKWVGGFNASPLLAARHALASLTARLTGGRRVQEHSASSAAAPVMSRSHMRPRPKA